jgi:CO/xanthine dehydrogenase Mo-binding subunit
VITPAVDMGQGAETVMAQIAAQTIGVRPADVIVRTEDTELTSYELGAFGSRTTFVCGNAVKNAAEKVRDEVISLASEMLGFDENYLVSNNGHIWLEESPEKLIKSAPFKDVVKFGITEKGRNISVSGEYFDPIAPTVSLTKGYGIHIPIWSFGCYVAELEVDLETGQVKVLQVWAANDAGTIINRNMAEGQVEGGIVQGIGYALTENFIMQDGRVVTDSYVDYKLPVAKDIPKIHCIFVETENSDGPFGAKGLGEHPLVAVAPAISNAIYDAIGVRLKDLPYTPDKILNALESKQAE